jgi:molybdopterin-binding protein
MVITVITKGRPRSSPKGPRVPAIIKATDVMIGVD